jgi:hypothetical protein
VPVSRLLTVGCVAVLAAPLGAQQMMQPPSTAQEAALKNNVRTFEMALKTAVERAGAQLVSWASQQSPVPMAFAQDPSVRSVPLLDNSIVFHVEVAEIVPTSLGLWLQYNQMPRQGAARPVGNTPGVAPPGPGKAAGDAMDMTPDQHYTALVRNALIDTMLDSSGVLPLREGQTLTVACIPVDVAVTNPVQRNQSRQLILTIKGEDVIALRQGTLSREDAKQRIIERRF